MEEDEDDFFAYQAAKSLNNKRTQLRRFLQAPVIKKQSSSSNESESENENELISLKKPKSTFTSVPVVQPIIVPTETIPQKDLIKNQIDAIVTSCFASTTKEVKRKIKLSKRTSADDQQYENEDEYLTQIMQRQRNGRVNRDEMNFLNKSQLEEDDEKVTRETAAYDRLDAVLRVTKPLYEKQIELGCEDENSRDLHEPIETTIVPELGTVYSTKPLSFDTIAIKVDHADGRQFTLSLPSTATLKDLYDKVAARLSLPSIYLVYDNQTLKLDNNNHSITLKQLNFSPDNIQLVESYPSIHKLKIFIQTSSSHTSKSIVSTETKTLLGHLHLDRRSSLPSKREYTMLDTDRFEVVFDAYKRDMKSTDIRFEFDGDKLDPRATPLDYDMADGEIIDAFIQSTINNSSSTQKNESKMMKTKEIIFDDDSDN